jgi:signal transduction histidine kinase
MGSAEELRDSAKLWSHWGLRRSQLGARLDAFLARRSPAAIMAAGLVSLLIIWVLDVVTGPRVAPSLFYTMPVILVTWRLGVLPGVTVAVLSATAWVSGDLVAGTYRFVSFFTLWNIGVRLTLLTLLALLNIGVRARLKHERDTATREAAAADRLRDINELKDTLLHAISHDLKGPITAILGSAQSLRRHEQLELTREDEDAFIEAIVGSGRKLNRLVDDLLDFERLDQGVIDPDRRPTDLGAMARGLVAEADYLAQHPTMVVADPLEASVDGPKAERIIENLLRNAAKHTPVGTQILVKIEEDPGGVLVSVEDEGPGVPNPMKDKVFEPFRQGTDARAAGSGAGLGLSLVAKFAALHAGSAWVEDRPGGGSAFRVHLPGEVRRLGG